MTHLPSPHGFQSPVNIQKRIARTPRFHWITANAEELFVIIALSAIGLLATINVVLRFPDLGLLIESYNKF